MFDLSPFWFQTIDGVLGSAYVHCSFVWFPSILNYESFFVYSFCFSSLEQHPMNLFKGTPYSFNMLRTSSFLELFSGILEFVLGIPFHSVYLGHPLSSSVIRVCPFLYFLRTFLFIGPSNYLDLL